MDEELQDGQPTPPAANVPPGDSGDSAASAPIESEALPPPAPLDIDAMPAFPARPAVPPGPPPFTLRLLLKDVFARFAADFVRIFVLSALSAVFSTPM